MNKDTFWGTSEHNRSSHISPETTCFSVPNLEEVAIPKSSSHHQSSPDFFLFFKSKELHDENKNVADQTHFQLPCGGFLKRVAEDFMEPFSSLIYGDTSHCISAKALLHYTVLILAPSFAERQQGWRYSQV